MVVDSSEGIRETVAVQNPLKEATSQYGSQEANSLPTSFCFIIFMYLKVIFLQSLVDCSFLHNHILHPSASVNKAPDNSTQRQDATGLLVAVRRMVGRDWALWGFDDLWLLEDGIFDKSGSGSRNFLRY